MSAPIRHERIEANGLEFHVNACGEGDRLALCLHGFPELGLSWEAQLPALAGAGYRAWAPDLRGYGKSSRPGALADYAIEHLLDDVAGLIDASGAKETVLLAHDWGAMIAWYFASQRVRPLDRLVILNGPPPGGIERPRSSFFSRAAWRNFYVLPLQFPWFPERALARNHHGALVAVFTGRMAGRPEKLSREHLAAFRAAAAEPGATTAMLNYYRALIRGGGLRRLAAKGFPKIETPTLLIWGDADPILTPDNLTDVERWVADATVRYLHGVGHWTQQEAPDEVNEILCRWLAGDEVPGAREPSSPERPQN